MIKAVISDLDSTLLNDKKQISPCTKHCINKLRQQGIYFIIATARPKDTTLHLVQNLEFDAAIFQNGAHLLYHDAQETYTSIASADTTHLIQTIQQQCPLQKIAVEMVSERYANFDCSNLWPDVIFMPTNFLTPFKTSPLKVLLPEYKEHRGTADAVKRQKLLLTVAEGTLAMITHAQATKWQGLKKVLHKLGIPPSQTISFGDDVNDLEMLTFCGMGIAMANAVPEVKAAADDLTFDNNHDGVAAWLTTNLLH